MQIVVIKHMCHAQLRPCLAGPRILYGPIPPPYWPAWPLV